MLKRLLMSTAMVLAVSTGAYAQSATSGPTTGSGTMPPGATTGSPSGSPTADNGAPGTSTGGTATAPGSATTGGPVPDRPAGTGSTATATPAPDALKASTLIGLNVRNPQDETIGEIDDVVVSKDGQIEQVVVSVGGFLGIGSKKVAIDWDELKMGDQGDVAMVSMTRDQLRNAPEFVERERPASTATGSGTNPTSRSPATAPTGSSTPRTQ